MTDCNDVKLHSVTVNGKELESECTTANDWFCSFKIGEIEGESNVIVHIKTLHNPEMLNNPAPDHKLMKINWAQAPAFNPNLINRKSTIVNLAEVNTKGLELPPSHT